MDKFRFRMVEVPVAAEPNPNDPKEKYEADMAKLQTEVVNMDPSSIVSVAWFPERAAVVLMEPVEGPSEDRPYGRLVRRAYASQTINKDRSPVLTEKIAIDPVELIDVQWQADRPNAIAVATVWRAAEEVSTIE